jgi:hypothetical protein
VQLLVDADCATARLRVRDSRGYGAGRALLWEQLEAVPEWRRIGPGADPVNAAIFAAFCG